MFTNIYILFIYFFLKERLFGIIIQVYSIKLFNIRNERKKFMRSKKRFIFLPIIILASFLLGACNDAPVEPNPPTPPGPVEVTYTVSFVSNGGSGMMPSISTPEGKYVLPECEFTAPSGKFFAGWKVNGEGNFLQPGAKIIISSNTRLVAQWNVTTYTVSFDANGGTGTMSPVSDKLGDYILPECGFTAPEGKHFTGWKVNNEGYLLQPGSKIDVASNITIVAQWAITTYTVSFDANSGTGTMNPSKDQVGEYVLPECGFTAPEGKHFIGWKVNGEGNTLEPGAKINVGSNVSLVAQWVITTYTVSFASNGGTGSMTAVDNQVGEYTLPACDFTAPSGEHFIGWRINNEGGLLQVGSTINVGSNVSLYAQWATTTYTVSFASNGGTGSMTDVIDQLGEFTLPDCKFTAPEGNHFDGWKVNGQGDTLKVGVSITVSADTQLVAQWAVTKYTVSFASNGGKGTMADIPEQIGEFTLPEPTYEIPQVGQHFAGWKVNGEGNALQAGEKINITADTQLVAQWAVNKYNVEFKANGQTIKTIQVAHGETATYTGDTPTKPGDANAYKYRFNGWDKNLKETVITSDTVFEAKFQPYAEKILIDDFESYSESADMLDAGWKALGYKNNQWSTDTKAAVSLSSKSEEGEKSLRFDSWENGDGYKIAVDFEDGNFTQSANALSFKLMTPSINTLKVILYADVTYTYQGQTITQNIKFIYELHPTTGGFIDYTLPFADDNWLAWGKASNGSLHELAESANLCEDDVTLLTTMLEFYLEGSDSVYGLDGLPYASFLDSVAFVTVDDLGSDAVLVEDYEVYSTFTGHTAGDNIAKLTVGDNGVARLEIIDEEVPTVVNGLVTIDSNKNTITFTSDDEGTTLVYNGKFSNTGQLINYTSISGSKKNVFGEIKFNAVQGVENAEQYTEDGVSYHIIDDKTTPKTTNSIEDRSGARGAYFSEYYSNSESDSSPFGGKNWCLMAGNGDQLKLKDDGLGHNGSSQYLCMKSSKDKPMRYMQWGLFDGSSEKNAFRGSKLSFWAKTNGYVPEFTVNVYSQSHPTNATRDSYVRKGEFDELGPISEWKHFEVDLNPNVVYYGFWVYMPANGRDSDTYLYIDDVEIYTDSPYAEYVPPITSLSIPNKTLYVANKLGLINAQIEIVDESNLTLTCQAKGINVNGTYSTTLDEIEMVFDGATYVGEISEGVNSITYKSVEGSSELATFLTDLSFNMIDYADNFETYDKNGKMYYQSNKDESKISGARGAYLCDYHSGSGSPFGSDWSLMGGTGNQLSLDNTTAADGKQSLSIKKSTAGEMRYIQWSLYKGTSTPHIGYNKFAISLKNKNNFDVSIKIYVFTAQQLDFESVFTSRVEREIVVPANQDWTEYYVDLDSSVAYYGYGMELGKADAEEGNSYLNVDKAYFCNDFLFSGKTGMSLTGTVTGGAATLTFVPFENKKNMTITCGSLSLTEVKYGMSMNGLTQEMTITVIKKQNGINKNSSITGTYSVSPEGVVTFTITEVTGSLTSYFNVGAVLTNS